MTAFVRTSFQNYFVDRDKRDRKHLYAALAGNSLDSDGSFSKLFGLADFVINGTTDSNDGVTVSPAFLSDTLNSNTNLNAFVQFPANTVRTVMVGFTAQNGSNRHQVLTKVRVLGGATPTILGPLTFLTNVNAFFEGTSNGANAITANPTGCVGPEWSDGGPPTCGFTGVASGGAFVINWLPGLNGPSNVGYIQPMPVNVNPSAQGTAAFAVANHRGVDLVNARTTVFAVNPIAGGAVGIPAGTVQAHARIYPPIQATLFASGGNLNVGVQGLSSDVVTWRLAIFVGDAESTVLI